MLYDRTGTTCGIYIYAAWIAEVHQTQKYISSAAEPMVRAHTAYA